MHSWLEPVISEWKRNNQSLVKHQCSYFQAERLHCSKQETYTEWRKEEGRYQTIKDHHPITLLLVDILTALLRMWHCLFFWYVICNGNAIFCRTNIYINPPVAPPLVGGYGFSFGVPFWGGWGWSPFSFFVPGPSVAIGISGGVELVVLFAIVGAIAAVIRFFSGSRSEDDEY